MACDAFGNGDELTPLGVEDDAVAQSVHVFLLEWFDQVLFWQP
jgi:hypothetical protein